MVDWLAVCRLSTRAAWTSLVAVVSLVAMRLTKRQHRPYCVIRRLSEFPDLEAAKAPECPFVIRGAVDEVGAKFWSKLRSVRLRSPFKYDVMDRSHPAKEVVFRYWDDATLLAGAVARVGETGPLHAKVEERDRRRALDAIFASTTKTKSVAARFGGTFASFAGEDLERQMWTQIEKFVPKEPNSTVRRLGLWLSGPSTASSPHFDSFHNFYLTLAGEKVIHLAPPEETSKAFDCFPATHPEARQAKVDAFAVLLEHHGGGKSAPPHPRRRTTTTTTTSREESSQQKKNTLLSKKTEKKNKASPPFPPAAVMSFPAPPRHAFEIRLKPGDAVFIPAGWIHRVASVEAASAAVSLTTLPLEFSHFEQFVTSKGSVVPFLSLEKTATPRRVAATLKRFSRTLHDQVLLPPSDKDDAQSRGTEKDNSPASERNLFRDLVERAYDATTRRGLGLRDRAALAADHGGECPWSDDDLSSADARAADAAARQVADVFNTVYRPSLRDIYLPPFFETILTRLPRTKNATALDVMNNVLAFVDLCLLSVPAAAEQRNATATVAEEARDDDAHDPRRIQTTTADRGQSPQAMSL
mmetsp:Transcript_19852/g.63889  ORF Transcript_19852/g.63889 Transcript_19852/m.63889 type:complete len:584 (+) Transcript_19852:121-1872(+)